MECIVCKNNLIKLKECYVDKKDITYSFFECVECKLIMSNPFTSAKSEHYEGMDTYKERWEFGRCLEKINLNKDSILLEVGCGEGYFASHALAKYPNYIGLDFNKKAIDKCNDKFENGKFLTEDLNIYIVENNLKIDAFFMFHVLEHLDDPISFLKNVLKFIKPNGSIVISLPSDQRLSLYYNSREQWDNPPHHLTRWNKKAISELAKVLNVDLKHLEYEPLQFKTYLEFNIFNRKYLTGIENKFLRKSSKLLCLPIMYLSYIFLRENYSDQAMLLVLEK